MLQRTSARCCQQVFEELAANCPENGKEWSAGSFQGFGMYSYSGVLDIFSNLLLFLPPSFEGFLQLLDLAKSVTLHFSKKDEQWRTSRLRFSYCSMTPGFVLRFISKFARWVSNSACSSSDDLMSMLSGTSGGGIPCSAASLAAVSYSTRSFSICLYCSWTSGVFSSKATRPRSKISVVSLLTCANCSVTKQKRGLSK